LTKILCNFLKQAQQTQLPSPKLKIFFFAAIILDGSILDINYN